MSRDSVIQICKDLGIKRISISGDELHGSCPFGYHEDIHPSWGINLNSGLYHCFSCNEDGNLLNLVMRLKDLDFIEAQAYLEGQMPGSDDLSELQQRIERLTDENGTIYYDDSILSTYLNIGDVFTNYRNIPFYIYERYEVKYDPLTKRIAIPIRDRFGRLRAVVGRSIETEEPKYKPIFPESGARFKDILYGEWEMPAPTRTGGSLIIVEGYWGVYRLNLLGVQNVAALMGTSLSEEQQRKLLLYDNVCLFLDPDEAGRKATEEITKRLSGQVLVKVSGFRYTKEPDEWDKDDLRRVFLSLKAVMPLWE